MIPSEQEGFLRACAVGDLATVSNWLKKESLNVHVVDHMERNAIHLAVVSGNCRIIKKLLLRKVDPNLKDCLAKTPLHYSVLRRPSVRVSKLLLEYGAVVPTRSHCTDPGLFLDLIILCKPTQEEITLMKLLLNYGAILEDPNAPGGRQALHYAAMSNNVKLVQVLLSLGADPKAKTKMCKTPAEVAAVFHCNKVYEILDKLQGNKDISKYTSICVTSNEILESFDLD